MVGAGVSTYPITYSSEQPVVTESLFHPSQRAYLLECQRQSGYRIGAQRSGDMPISLLYTLRLMCGESYERTENLRLQFYKR